MSNILVFRISHGRFFLVFGMSNAKYLAFDTLDGNALTIHLSYKSPCVVLKALKEILPN